jgi:hypothetical protein
MGKAPRGATTQRQANARWFGGGLG